MQKKRIVDLHLHSSASDGIFKPAELFKIVAAAGLSAAALTDHDTVNGLEEAKTAAIENNLELVPGVEISVLEDDEEIHILGYYPRDLNLLQEVLIKVQEERRARMERMVDKLNRRGIAVTLEEVKAEAGSAAPGRPHLARVLQKRKYVHTTDEAFSLYLHNGGLGYEPRRTLCVREVMDLLKDIKAIPVIAHPGSKAEYLLDKLLPLGLMGIEVFHPEHGKQLENKLKLLAEKNGLLITGGSDYHGVNRDHPAYPKQKAISAVYLEKLQQFI